MDHTKLSQQEIILGKAIRPHGLKGVVSCQWYHPESLLLRPGTKVLLVPLDTSLPAQTTSFQGFYPQQKALVNFSNFDDRNSIERFLPCLIKTWRHELPPIENEQEYYF